MKAWIAIVKYKARIAPDEREVALGILSNEPHCDGIEVEYDLDDQSELAGLIERGPGWAAVQWVYVYRSDEARFPATFVEDLREASR